MARRVDHIKLFLHVIANVQVKNLLLLQTAARENADLLASATGIGSNTTDSTKMHQELDDLKNKYDKSNQETKRLKNELHEALKNVTDLEIANAGLKQTQEASEADLKDQLGLMTSRVQDLTAKLATAEKKVRKLEKRLTRKSRRNSSEINSVDNGKEKVIECKEIGTSEDVLNTSNASSGGVDEIVASVRVSAFSASKPMEDDQGSDSEKSTFSDPEVVHRLRKLQGELEISKEKVHELQMKDSEFKSLQQTAQQLREQNKMFKDQISYMQAKLQSATVGEKDSSDFRGRLKEVEHRLNQSESLMKDCREKLSDVINELGTFGIIPTKDNYSSTIENLRDRLREILKEVEEVSKETGESEGELKSDIHLDLDSTIKIFAEKLSLEALVIGEMATLLRSSQNDVISDGENHLCEIQFANKHILDLEQKIDLMKTSNNNIEDPSLDITKSSLQACSDLLAEKMVVQAQILATLENNKYVDEAGRETATSQGYASKLAQEAMFRSKLDLPIYSASTFKECEQALGLASKVLVQGELAFTVNKLRERMSSTMTDQERIDLLEQELELAEHRLRDRESNLAESVQSFISSKTTQFAEIWLHENQNNETVDSPEKELEEMLKNYAKVYEKQVNPKVCSSDIRRHEHIVRAVSTASEYLIQKLTTSVENECVSGSKKTKLTLSAMEVLENLAEVVANKAVISGQIAYLKEQLEIRSIRNSPSGADTARNLTVDGRCGSPGSAHSSNQYVLSRPSSISPQTTGTTSTTSSSQESTAEVADHLSQEASVRQHLVSLLLTSIDNASLETDEAVKHITNLARRLVQLDSGFIKQRHSVQDYAEMVTREAMFQAQMAYVVNCLRVRHESELKEVHEKVTDIKQRVSDIGGCSSFSSSELEEYKAEVDRLTGEMEEKENEWKIVDESWQKHINALEQDIQHLTQQVIHSFFIRVVNHLIRKIFEIAGIALGFYLVLRQ